MTTVPAPRLRRDLNLGTLWDLPTWSTGPRGEPDDVLAAVAAAGYEAVQGSSPERCAPLGLACTASGRVDAPGEALPQAQRWADKGYELATLHVGTGLEDDGEVTRLAEAIVDASRQTGLPLYVETHRATMTQDIWRTVRLAERIPELRFNADLSHWYTGLEMVYGDFDAKVEAMAPVLERVGYFHGRIGDPGCIQVAVDGEDDPRPFVGHFRTMWTHAMRAWKANAAPGDVLGFAPELLPASIHYARTVPGPEGRREECDRWEQAAVLCSIAEKCFADA